MRARIAPLALTGLLGLALAFSAIADEPEIPAFARDVPQVRTGPPILQFTGKDLTGFYTYLKENKYEDPKGVFTVKDGILRISGEEWGGVVTKAEYENYQLVVEWKWGEKTWKPRLEASRDSGILLHCVGDDGAAGGQWLES